MTQETVKKGHPTSWQGFSIRVYGKFDKGDIDNMGSEIMNHTTYSPDLAFTDFRVFGLTKLHLGGQKFQTDDELKRGVLNLLRGQDETFCAVGISNLPGWKNVLL
jgi:hypothetical protein